MPLPFVLPFGMTAFQAFSVAATAFSMYSSIQAGKAQEAQYKAQAKREELSAREKELDRRRNLVRAMASQNAARAAQGISASQGSAGAMFRADTRDFERAQTVGRYNRDFAVQQNLNKASNAKRSGYMDAAGSLLDFGMRTTYRGKA